MSPRVCMLLVLMVLALFAAAPASAQDRSLPPPSMGKATLRTIPPKPMFAYVNGQKKALKQAFNFVAIAFKKELISKEERQAYYKRLRLVVSELNEPAARAKNMWVVRLTDGADEKKWNIFAAYMENDPELAYVERVFIEVKASDKTETLIIPTREIDIRFPKTPTSAELDKVVRSYPLLLTSHDPISPSATYTVSDIHVDTLDLANRLHESATFAAVSPAFIEIHGKKVDDAYRERVFKEYQAARPKDDKNPPPTPAHQPDLPQYNPNLKPKAKPEPAPAPKK